MSATLLEDTKQKRTDASLIKEGDVFTRHSAGIVTGVDHTMVYVKNSEGMAWQLSKEIAEGELSFAGHTQGDPVELNRSDMINLVKKNPRTAMTITFNKKVEGRNVADLLKEGQGEMTDRAWVIKVNRAIKGEQSTLAGHHTNGYSEHGRLYFTCLGETTGLRKIDLREVTEVICNNTLYVLK